MKHEFLYVADKYKKGYKMNLLSQSSSCPQFTLHTAVIVIFLMSLSLSGLPLLRLSAPDFPQ